jgi:hypothetical protein
VITELNIVGYHCRGQVVLHALTRLQHQVCLSSFVLGHNLKDPDVVGSDHPPPLSETARWFKLLCNL